MEVRVSYVLTTRNRAEYLARALENVREYITPQDELIVIDGASTDNTAEVVKANTDIVTIFRSEPDFGEAHGLNKGLLASKGRFIRPLSDDDYVYPEAMKVAISVMESHPELDAVQCGGEAYRFDASTGRLSLFRYEYLPPEHSLTDIQNVYRYVTCGLGLILTRRCLERVGLVGTTFRMVDVEYMSRIIRSGAVFRYLNLKLYRHVTYPHSGERCWSDDIRDRTRILLRHRRWEALTRCPPLAVSEALGLSEVRGGEGLALFVILLEAVRRRVPWLFLPAAGAYRLVLLVRRVLLNSSFGPAIRQLRARLRRIRQANCTPGEPYWDGSLR